MEARNIEDENRIDDPSPTKTEPKKSKRALPERAASSALGARMFYFITYGLFYLTLMIYKNPLRDIILFQVDFSFVNLLYVVYFVGVHGLGIHYFMTAGDDPGFVSDTQTEFDHKSHEMRQVKH